MKLVRYIILALILVSCSSNSNYNTYEIKYLVENDSVIHKYSILEDPVFDRKAVARLDFGYDSIFQSSYYILYIVSSCEYGKDYKKKLIETSKPIEVIYFRKIYE